MKLKRGYIAYFRYRRYHKDPYPLALVLYVGDELIHCLNIHYLSQNLTDDLVEMIVKVALKRLKSQDQYRFYHNYMKRYLPNVIKASYRTYKPGYITDVVIVSKGFEMTAGFLNALKKLGGTKFTQKKTEKVVKKEIDKVEQKKKTPEEIKKMEKITSKQIAQNVDEYFKAIKQIVKYRTDREKYTGVKRKTK